MSLIWSRDTGRFGKPAQYFPSEQWKRQQQAFASDLGENQLHECFVSVDAGSAEFVDLALRRGGRQGPRNSFSDVPHIDRLQLRFATAEQRQDWHHARQGGQAVEECVLRAEDNARAEDGGAGKSFFDQVFADTSGTDIWGVGRRIGTEA